MLTFVWHWGTVSCQGRWDASKPVELAVRSPACPLSPSPTMRDVTFDTGANHSVGGKKKSAMTIFSVEKKRSTLWGTEIAFTGDSLALAHVMSVLRLSDTVDSHQMWGGRDFTCVARGTGLEGRDRAVTPWLSSNYIVWSNLRFVNMRDRHLHDNTLGFSLLVDWWWQCQREMSRSAQ